jgi:cell division septal protein FtsQ
VVLLEEENMQRERWDPWAAARVRKLSWISLGVLLGFYIFVGWAFEPKSTHVVCFVILFV